MFGKNGNFQLNLRFAIKESINNVRGHYNTIIKKG